MSGQCTVFTLYNFCLEKDQIVFGYMTASAFWTALRPNKYVKWWKTLTFRTGSINSWSKNRTTRGSTALLKYFLWAWLPSRRFQSIPACIRSYALALQLLLARPSYTRTHILRWKPCASARARGREGGQNYERVNTAKSRKKTPWYIAEWLSVLLCRGVVSGRGAAQRGGRWADGITQFARN